jgi:phosphoglycolate phosphatase
MQSHNLLAIFDLDGTLVDSSKQIGKNLNKARADFNYSILPESFYEENVGLPIDYLICDLDLSEISKFELIGRFRQYLRSEILLGENKIFPGVRNLLEFLVANGVELAIATSKPTELAICVYQSSELRNFRFTVQGTDGFPAKPDPEVIQRVLLQFPNAKALMIGDRSEDMLAAFAANISGVGIAAGAHSISVLSKAGASIAFSSMVDFSNHLTQGYATISSFFK